MIAKPVFPIIGYFVNYEYVSKVLCVNKSKPKMHCNGKCQLMKELAKNSETDAPISSSKKNISEQFEVLFLEEIKSFQIESFCFFEKENEHKNYSNLYFRLNNASFFHPPNFVL